MNNILITGLGVASDFGICEVCQLNFSWLVNSPSIVLWADKLIIPKMSYEKQSIRRESKDEKVIGLFLDLAEEYGFIDKIDLSSIYQDSVAGQLYERMLADSEVLLKTFPDSIKKGDGGVPDEIIIGGEGYCGAWLSSIYANMKVANDVGANCLFGKREHTFLKYLYGIDASKTVGNALNSVYSEVFSLYLPENLAVHSYAFADEKDCKKCVHHKKCRDNYLADTEKALQTMFKWREYDELQQAKAEIDKIISLKNEISSQKDIDDVVKEFKSRQERINKNINKRFPRIERWTKMTAVLATPLTIASAVTGNMPLTIGGAVVTGIAQAAEELLEVYKSKNNWVGFVNDMRLERN